MKLHYKEWPSLTLVHKGNRHIGVESIAAAILPERNCTWHVWDDSIRLERLYLFRSRNRYFQFAGSEDELPRYFEDSVHPRSAGRGKIPKIEYPLYYLAGEIGDNIACTITAPYAGLLAEVFADSLDRLKSEGFSFVRPKIGLIYGLAMDGDKSPPVLSAADAFAPNRKTIVFRGGRLSLKPHDVKAHSPKEASPIEPIRSLVIVGQNILRSQLFLKLIKGGIEGMKFDIDDSLAKVAFKHGSALGVVVKMDRFGNYHLRPGYGGKNLDSFMDLLSFCDDGHALGEADTKPFGRPARGEFE